MPLSTSAPLVALSTSSVYPDDTAMGFEVARRLGFDGVEVMVGLDPVAADPEALRRLRDYHEVPVLAIHAPCLLVTQRVWGTDPWGKLDRAAEAAHLLGAGIVVVHPPFRWQRSYADDFTGGIRRRTESSGVTFAVENMFPWRAPGGAEIAAYKPGWDPGQLDYDHLTLDLSHASTARQRSLQLVDDWGERLAHVHLTDGRGDFKDEHLLPGDGDQQVPAVLRRLVETGYRGHLVLEVNTSALATRGEREAALARALAFTRAQLAQAVPDRG